MRKYNTAVLQTYKGESEPSALPFPHSLAATSLCSSFSTAVKKKTKKNMSCSLTNELTMKRSSAEQPGFTETNSKPN